jgi:serine protease Do
MASNGFKSHLLRGSAAAALLLALSVSSTLVPTYAAPVAPGTQPLVTGAPDFSALVAKVSPAVVAITVTQQAQRAEGESVLPPELRGTPLERFFDRFGQGQGQGQGRGFGGQQPLRAVGSGFVIDTDGYIVTNNHVVQRAREVTVVFADSRQFTAKVVGTDPRTDLALLKIEAGAPLPAVAFGDSDKVLSGQWVVAVGNPFGLGGTVTAGIVSARGRSIGGGAYDDYLQIDAPINQGNSGGPSFDINGNVIGVNSAIYSPSGGGNVGVGFAIPANQVKEIVTALREHGRVDRGWLGVMMQEVSPSMAKALGLKDSKGALVVDVESDGPAARAGLQRGDVVLSVDGKPIDDGRALARRVAVIAQGTRVDVAVWRDGKQQVLPVTIGRSQEKSAALGRPDADTSQPSVGMTLAPAPGRTGALVAGVTDESPAEKAGLRAGDLIIEVDRTKVTTPADVIEKLGAARTQHKSAVAVLIERDGRNLYLGLTFEPSKS